VSIVRRRWLLAVIVMAISIVALAPAAGSQPSQGFLFIDPAWSHDGKRIALTGRDGSGSAYLFVMNADGSNLHRIDTSRPNVPDEVGWPSWSPNDDRITFSTVDAERSGYIYSVWVVNSDGGGLRRVVPDAVGPAWSPGGRRIAYSEFGGDTSPGYIIRVVSPDGRDDRIVALPGDRDSQSYFGPTWSPDGERLAFAWYSFEHDSTGDRPAVASALDIDPNARGLGIISDYLAPPKFLLRGHSVSDPAWSPSGREIAFVYEGSVWLISLRTRRVTRLQSGVNPTWSPDGKRIAFVRGDFYGGSIYVMNRDGSHVRLLLQAS
jgi:Tol biopolymer transport system component